MDENYEDEDDDDDVENEDEENEIRMSNDFEPQTSKRTVNGTAINDQILDDTQTTSATISSTTNHEQSLTRPHSSKRIHAEDDDEEDDSHKVNQKKKTTDKFSRMLYDGSKVTAYEFSFLIESWKNEHEINDMAAADLLRIIDLVLPQPNRVKHTVERLNLE